MLWFLMGMACTKDVVIGVDNLPAHLEFHLRADEDSLSRNSSNQWVLHGLSSDQTVNLSLWYGNRECQLSNPTVNAQSIAEGIHHSSWTCIGLGGYEMLELREASLWVGQSEMTNALWEQLTGSSANDDCGPQCPKNNVTWGQTLEFANQLSMLEGLEQCYTKDDSGEIIQRENCTGYRLPSNAEWEVFADVASNTKYSGSDTVTEVGWINSNSAMKRHPVCQLKPNKYGLCDVTGNVWEWCWDALGKTPNLRRVRGGGFSSLEDVARLDNIVDFPMSFAVGHVGFRLVRNR